MSLTETPDERESPRGRGASVRNNPSGIRSGRPPARRRPGATPGIAAISSLIFPGAGQLLAGATRRGFLVALPTVIVILVVGAALAGGTKALLTQLVQPGVVLGIIVVNGIFAIYHLFAIGDAWWVARRIRPGTGGPRSAAALAVALVLAVGLHGLLGGIGVQAYQTVSTVIAAPGTGIEIPAASFAAPTPNGPNQTLVLPTPTPTPGPAFAADGRLNLLLVGADSGPGRYRLRTDTMILLSVDVATGRAALFGIPRNLVNVPLAPEDARAFKDGLYPGLLNSLWVYAIDHPKVFPGGSCTPDTCDEARGFRALTGAIQQLTGVALDGAVIVNLNGFVKLVNAVAPKGVWIRTVAVHDDKYPLEDGSGDVVLDISAECRPRTGHLLLAYARSRHQDSDYGRMARQQQVLVALLHQLDPIEILPQVPTLLDIAKDNLTLAVPSADLGSLASLASTVDPDTVQRIGFDPPTYFEFLKAETVSRIQQVVATVFSANPVPAKSSSTSATPHPTATPKPCPPP